MPNKIPKKDCPVIIYFKDGSLKVGFINITGFDRLSDYLQQPDMVNGHIKLYGIGNPPFIIPVGSINYYQPLEP